ncbi:cobalt-precorrin-6A reductase [Aureimonas fodinaquatilis]|uniref:Cobalt-precorrin-6A reductase n=1 Tax=Aureimonas fodinaquatilis TaxID=2565783 RepID=A0A5B0DUD3_9HYPH|nr:cobalt-precorrin-6A reductase [Aureimonas fodinaquatilis]KAA0969545.1 cobalt-precorrin-6A reductase [Aureimonas fodinaquatilis]
MASQGSVGIVTSYKQAGTLVLGGTAEAAALARAMAAAGLPGIFSYAGRTDAPASQPLPTRIGGFGGVDGLVEFLIENKIRGIVDATHPFAAQMSRNAIAAARVTGVPLLALERPAWAPELEDQWQVVQDVAGAVAALSGPAERVFLAIGRQNLADFAGRPQHHYLLRVVDPWAGEMPLANAHVVVARGPFDVEGDAALLRSHGITRLVAKNAGGAGAVAKVLAARQLALPVIMIARPILPDRAVVNTVDAALQWLHSADLGV